MVTEIFLDIYFAQQVRYAVPVIYEIHSSNLRLGQQETKRNLILGFDTRYRYREGTLKFLCSSTVGAAMLASRCRRVSILNTECLKPRWPFNTSFFRHLPLLKLLHQIPYTGVQLPPELKAFLKLFRIHYSFVAASMCRGRTFYAARGLICCLFLPGFLTEATRLSSQECRYQIILPLCRCQVSCQCPNFYKMYFLKKLSLKLAKILAKKFPRFLRKRTFFCRRWGQIRVLTRKPELLT